MDNKVKKIAIMYDFDYTLTYKCMQEFGLFPEIMGMSWESFIQEKRDLEKRLSADSVSAYLYLILKKAKEKNIKITREGFNKLGKNIEYFLGVESWFDRINKFGEEQGVVIEHFVLSSGIKELIDGCSIAKHFKKIYACEYFYNDEGLADGVSNFVNFTNKTQFVFRINKGCLDVNDDRVLNSYVPQNEREIPFTNMIYFGDGDTDVPCMQLIKDKGGKSVAVYNEKNFDTAERLYKEGRVNFFAPADYREGSFLELSIKAIIKNMAKRECKDIYKDA
ncbi:MAG: HAD family hydrolase [Clostridia bacterium]|nr:HAD family hydrolase [Clostridia bacterium]